MVNVKQGSEEVKTILNQYRRVKWMIEDLDQQIESVDDRMYSIKSGQITGMPRGSKPVTSADFAAEKDALISRKLRFEKIAKQKREIVQSYIDTVLSVKHNRLLTFHYVQCKSIREISIMEHYSKRHAFRIFSEAIEMVDLSLDL